MKVCLTLVRLSVAAALVLAGSAVRAGQDMTDKLLDELTRDSYRPPTAEEWKNSGLRAEDLATAHRYHVTIEEWKDMERTRKAYQIAGWSCIGLALLAPAIEATLHWGAGIPFTGHPNTEVFIVSNVAVGATLITGIVLVATAPEPEDFIKRWNRWQREKGLSFGIGPGGIRLGLRF
ncbi:MAG: hypothetical protein D6806_04455 [Deltaproteobacteria bacterium]|nr:MAG: hypothetical protein D6806_04455 [Deltaproteobacteria bacterium]